MEIKEYRILTFDVRKCAEKTTRAVSSLLHVITLGRLVDLRVELLFGTCMTVAAGVARFTITRLAPLLAVLYIWARCTAIFILSW